MRCVAPVGNDLGESPLWDDERQCLWWIDAWRSTLWQHWPASNTTRPTVLGAPLASQPIGSIALDRRGDLLVAGRTGFWRLALDTGQLSLVAQAEQGRPASNRLNDGKCDRAGRFWCGSLNTDWTQETGAVYRLDADGQVACMVERHGISNGIAFSPDDTRFYLADSRLNVIWQYDFNLASGDITNRRLFADLSALGGKADGATVDSAGHYWCALFGRGAVLCFDPAGRLLQRIELPARDITMCTFGGPQRQTLYVTSARRFLAPADEGTQPLAGALFAIEGLGNTGLREPRFLSSKA